MYITNNNQFQVEPKDLEYLRTDIFVHSVMRNVD